MLLHNNQIPNKQANKKSRPIEKTFQIFNRIPLRVLLFEQRLLDIWNEYTYIEQGKTTWPENGGIDNSYRLFQGFKGNDDIMRVEIKT